MTAEYFQKKHFLPFLCLLICLLNIGLYIQTIGFDFLLDDHFLIENNPRIKDFSNFFSSLNEKFFAFPAMQALPYWRPAVLLSYFLEYKIWGKNPAGYHWTNIILNALNALLIFFIFLRLSGQTLPSFAIAVIFSIHPIHSENVSWISGRTDLLSAFFILLSILLFIQYLKKDDQALVVASLFFFAVALLAKENSVVLPLILLFFIFLFRPGSTKKMAYIISPFFIIGILYLSIHQHFVSTRDIFSNVNFSDIFLVIKTLGAYAEIILLPFSPGPYFSMEVFARHNVQFFLLAIFIVILLFVILKNRKVFTFSFHALPFLIFMLPLLYPKLIPSYPNIGIRFVYLPGIFLAALVVDIFIIIKNRHLKVLIAILLFILCSLLVFQVFYFQHFFKNDQQYFEMMQSHFDKDFYSEPHFLLNQSLMLANKKQYHEALQLVERTIKSGQKKFYVFDFSEPARLYKANILIVLGRYDQGQEIADKILKSSKQKDSHYFAYLIMAKLYEKKNNPAMALKMLNHALELGQSPDIYLRITFIYLQMSDPAGALEYLEKARKLDPDLPGYEMMKSEITSRIRSSH